MKHLITFILVVLQISLTTSLAASSEKALANHIPTAITNLKLKPLGSLPASQSMRISIGLPLRNREELAQLLQQVYDPNDAQYRHYLTPSQFTARFGPTEADYDAVVAFARSNGLAVASLDRGRMLVNVSATVADIERVCHVKFSTYQHPKELRTFYAPKSGPWLDLKTPILHITGLDNFVIPHTAGLRMLRSESVSPNAGSAPGGNLMGYDFRAAYAPLVSQTGTGQTVALLEFDGYYASDITAYENLAGLPAVPLTNVYVDGFSGTPSTNANKVLEVSMDIEMVIAMAPGLSGILVYEGLFGNNLLNQIATDNLAQQVSSSWEFNVDVTTLQLLQQMASQGQSFFQASADGGAYVGGRDLRYNREPFGDNPYVTSVGGTTLTTSGSGGFWVSETVWNNYASGSGPFASGGGISTNYSIPYWQTNTSMASNGGSYSMRNSPDVAMSANNIWVIYNNGKSGSFWGTSAAAPLWPGFTALVNETAAANGTPPVGFLNPTLYNLGNGSGYASFFHDITTGNNTNGTSPNLYFAVPGYDLCTGWGSPKGMNLIRALAFQGAFQDPISVSPLIDFYLSGAAGGPFTMTNQTFSLKNQSLSNLVWSVASSNAWLTVYPNWGVLMAGKTTDVAVSISPLATNLAEALYSGNIVFRNDTLGTERLRSFTLQVGLLPTTFDDLSGTGISVPDGYTGLYWSNFNYLAPLTLTNSPSGYQSGLISSSNVIYNRNGNPASIIGTTPFDLLSAYVTAAWRDNLTLQMTGYLAGSSTFTFTTNLSTTTPLLIQFNCFGVDRVDFVTSGGTTNSIYSKTGFQFVMDNVLVVPHLSSTPSPLLQTTTYSGSSIGLGWVAQLGRTYQLQYATTLSSNWTMLGFPITATNAVLNITDTAQSKQRFYRLIVNPGNPTRSP